MILSDRTGVLKDFFFSKTRVLRFFGIYSLEMGKKMKIDG